jgi:hypothetical protein
MDPAVVQSLVQQAAQAEARLAQIENKITGAQLQDVHHSWFACLCHVLAQLCGTTELQMATHSMALATTAPRGVCTSATGLLSFVS